MLRLLHRHPFRLSIVSNRSCPTHLRFLHDTVPKTLNPSVTEFTVPYLVQSYGLSPEAALSVAKKFTFKTTTATVNADSFLSLLRAHGFTQSQIAIIATNYPALLTYNQEKKIKPKLEFFLSIGFSKADLIKLVSFDPNILTSSLEKRIKPNYDMLKSILGTDTKVNTAIGNYSQLLRRKLDRCMLPNMKTLRDLGVPGHRILKFATFYPRSLLKDPAQFNEAVDLLKKMGFDVSKAVFTLGIIVLCWLSEATWNRKLELYKRLGWSDEDTSMAFKRRPFCMVLSDEKIKQKFNFFAEELKWAPSYVAARPIFLFLSFEKTISPRYKIYLILSSKGLMKRNVGLSTFLLASKKKFFNQYVMKYADQVPELLEVYKDKLELSGVEAES